MNTTHSFPEALIVLALVGGFVAWLYFRHQERQRRIDIVHQERLIAMEKGFPLPELPSESVKPPTDHSGMLVQGVAWTALGLGGVVSLLLTGMTVGDTPIWPLALPLPMLGVGLILVYLFVGRRPR